MPKVTQAIQNYLNARKASHNGPDLLDRWTPNMETQVNVAADNGQAVEDKRNTWTDGYEEWWNIRIPKHADTDPQFRDYELMWPLDTHAEGIGCTGWDWCARRSRWVGFDFDSIAGHAKGVGLSDDELYQIRLKAEQLPYVEVRRSTAGKGIHLYVYFDAEGIPTANHTEHAALGRSILGMLSSATGFDFAAQVDVCGQNLWIWHRKMNKENLGLALLKPAEKILSQADLPANWKDHIAVVQKRRAKVKLGNLADHEQDPFEALANSRRIIALDERHHAVINALKESGFSVNWVSDHHLLQTHTAALKKLIDDPVTREALGLQGFFQTISQGRDPGTPNCFMFPMQAGSWRVYLFGKGRQESPTWTQDKEGWTNCYFNRSPDLSVAARALGGKQDPDLGGYVFDSAKQAIDACEALGQKVKLPESIMGREARLKAHKDGKLIMYIPKLDSDEGMSREWIKKKDKWVRMFDVMVDAKEDVTHAEYDSIVRQLISTDNRDAGWVVKSNSGEWQYMPTAKAQYVLLTTGITEHDAKLILGDAVRKSWKLVTLPFQPEYPGNRQWNLDAPQFVYEPAKLDDDRAPKHPHWDRILRHIGQDLDPALAELSWAKEQNIKTGAAYLLQWVACLLRDPYCKLPYLFLYGNEKSGKSILHEAISLLVTKGVVRADRSLTTTGDHNGELAGGILAVVEETNLGKDQKAHNRMKDLVTSLTLSVRKMRTDAYSQPNMLRFIQCGQGPEYCFIAPRDTRVTMVFVPDLEPGYEIPKPVLLHRLKDEAPAFMRTIMDIELCPDQGRLRLPMVKTANKERAEESNQDPVTQFLSEHCYEVAGEFVTLKDLYEKFQTTVSAKESEYWTKSRVASKLPTKYPYGAYSSNIRCVGNISFEQKQSTDKPFIRIGDRLKRKQ